MIEELQKQLEELSIQRFKERQAYYNYHDQQRPRLNKTYTLQNLYPDPFQIQINPTRQQEYFRYSTREGNQRDFQNYNTQNRPFTGSRPITRSYNNYRDWNGTRNTYRNDNNQYQLRSGRTFAETFARHSDLIRKYPDYLADVLISFSKNSRKKRRFFAENLLKKCRKSSKKVQIRRKIGIPIHV